MTREEDGLSFRVATPEKALCDKVSMMPPAANRAQLEVLLYEDLRLDQEDLAELSVDDIAFLAERYPSATWESSRNI